MAIIGTADADKAMSSSRAASLPVEFCDLGLGMCGRIQAVDVGASIAAGGVVAVARVVYKVRLWRADEVAQLVVAAYIRGATAQVVGGRVLRYWDFEGVEGPGRQHKRVGVSTPGLVSMIRYLCGGQAYKKSSTAMLQAQVGGGSMRTRRRRRLCDEGAMMSAAAR